MKRFKMALLVFSLAFVSCDLINLAYGGDDGARTTVPNAPAGVTASRNQAEPTTITVSWNAVSGAASYNIYYSSTGGSLGTPAGSSKTTSFSSPNRSTAGTHYFSVTAVNNAGEGARSSPVAVGPGSSVIAVPGAPTGVTASMNPAGSSPTASWNSTITVKWNAVSGAAGYRVYYSSTNSGGKRVGEPATNSFISTNHTTAGPHYFRVSAVNSAGESPRSSWVLVGDLKGVWTNSSITWTFNNGVFGYGRLGDVYLNGIYTTSYTAGGINLKITTIHVYINTAWKDESQFIEILKESGESEDSIAQTLRELGFDPPMEGAYSIDGNSLTMTLPLGAGVFSRQ